MKMEEEDEEPPLAIQINQTPLSHHSTVGVTVITGYLGAGKSTVSIHPHTQICILIISVIMKMLMIVMITAVS